MKSVLIAVCGLVLASTVTAQDGAYRDHLEVRGGAREVAIDPVGRLCIGTNHGRLLRSTDRARTWEIVDCPARPPDRWGDAEDRLLHVGFFDRDRGTVGGELGFRVLRSSDGGETWSFRSCPPRLTVYGGQFFPDGTGWLVGSAEFLLHSRNGGESWDRVEGPAEISRQTFGLHFVNREEGVIGGSGERIHHTLDGGETWRSLSTPVPKDPDRYFPSVLRLRLVGSFVVAVQGQKGYARPLYGEEEWRPLLVGSEPVVACDVHPEGLLVAAKDGSIALLHEDLEEAHRFEDMLPAEVQSVACADEFSAFLLRTGEVAILDEEGMRCSLPLSAYEGGRSWDVTSLDRTSDGTLWGTSEHFLHRSPDSGQRWRPVARLPEGTRGAFALTDASGAFLWGFDHVERWDAETGAIEPIGEFDGLKFDGMWRRGELWLAWGHAFATKEARRQLSMLHSVTAGEGVLAQLLCSRDGGRHWYVIDRYEGAAVYAVDLSADDFLTVGLAGGGIRRGPLTVDDDGIPRADLRTRRHPSAGGPTVGYGQWILFPTRDEGWSGGTWFHGTELMYHTTDGGTTWDEVDRSPDMAAVRVLHLGDGRWLRLDQDGCYRFWMNGEFGEPVPLPMSDEDEWIRDRVVTAAGGVLAATDLKAVWSLEPESETWTKLW